MCAVLLDQQMWQALSSKFPTSVCLPTTPPKLSSLLSGSLSQFLCHTIHIFWRELHGALIAARECVELGHFNMAAVQQRTVLLGPARRYWCQMSVQTERERKRGGRNRSSHIKHVPVEIQALSVSVCLSQQKKIMALWRFFFKSRTAPLWVCSLPLSDQNGGYNYEACQVICFVLFTHVTSLRETWCFPF